MFISRQASFNCVLLLMVLGLFVCSASVTATIWWWAVWPIAFLASQPLQAVLRMNLEHRSPRGKLDILTSLVGDSLLLPSALLAFGFAAYKTANPVYGSGEWLFSCFVVGVMAGLLLVMKEEERYQCLGAGDVAECPSISARYLVARPLQIGLVLFVGLPLLGSLHQVWPWVLIGILLIALNAVLGVIDRLRAIHPYDLYVAWDPKAFEPKKAR